MDGPMASAVVLPEPQEQEPPSASSPTALKRRQSSISEQDAKRPRLNSEDATVERRSSINDGKLSTKGPPRREGGRVKRLFGAALGALSQNSATAAQKRRSEIEKRQQAQRKLDDEESEQRKQEREARRKTQRQIEQKYFEKNSIRIRHENLLGMAHFLQTETEPRLYYKPWETSPEDDERIRDQITDAQRVIRQELDEYETRQREEQTQRVRHATREGATHHDAEDANIGKESNAADTSQQSPTANRDTNGSGSPPKDPELKDDHADELANKAVSEERIAKDAQDNSITSHEALADETSKENMDENGEEVVEATEDTVIY